MPQLALRDDTGSLCSSFCLLLVASVDVPVLVAVVVVAAAAVVAVVVFVFCLLFVVCLLLLLLLFRVGLSCVSHRMLNMTDVGKGD